MNKHHKSNAAAKPAKPNINVRPLVVSTAEAGRLGGHGKTKTFALIKAGEYESFWTVAFVASHLSQSKPASSENSKKLRPIRPPPETESPAP